MLNAVRRIYRRSSLFWRVGIERIFSAMSRRSRYFENPYYAREEEIIHDVVSMRRDIDDSKRAAKSTLCTMLQRIFDKEPADHAEKDGGLYVGASGIAYVHLRLAERAATLGLDQDDELTMSKLYLSSSLTLAKREGRVGTGFLLGLYLVTLTAGEGENSNE